MMSVQNEINTFCEKNRKLWSPPKNYDGYFLNEASNRSYSHVLAGRISKAIEEEKNVKTIMLLRTPIVPKEMRQVLDSFYIDHYITTLRFYLNPLILLNAFFYTLLCLFRLRTGDDLLALNFRGIDIGDLIYDEIIRFTKDRYTIEKLRLKDFRKVFDAHLRVLKLENIFKAYPIKFVFCRMVVFIHGGVLARIGAKYGASVIMLNDRISKNFQGRDIKEGQYTPRPEYIASINNDDTIKMAEEYLEKRFNAHLNDADIVRAYSDKKIYDRKSLAKKLNANPKLPYVFIIPHAFSDGSHHTNAKYMLYRDYYTWYLETLKLIAPITNVNWFVKPHPMSGKYHEEGVAEQVFHKHNGPTTYLLPDDFNQLSLKDCADTIITVTGKVGLEYSTLGIPVIVGARANYSGYNIAYEPKSVEEYKSMLNNIRSIKRLNEEQKKIAKVLTAQMFLLNKTHNNLLPVNTLRSGNIDEEGMWKVINQNMANYSKAADLYYQKTRKLINLELN